MGTELNEEIVRLLEDIASDEDFNSIVKKDLRNRVLKAVSQIKEEPLGNTYDAPWTRKRDNGVERIVDRKGRCVAVCEPETDSEVAELIAAAPEMFKLLLAVSESHESVSYEIFAGLSEDTGDFYHDCPIDDINDIVERIDG